MAQQNQVTPPPAGKQNEIHHGHRTAKRRENIAEYILYLWQIEDLLRALQFSPEAIYSQLIAPRGIEEGQRHNYLLW